MSCAPSLEVCYVMEMLTQHPVRDWDSLISRTEVVRRWYKMKWTDDCDVLANKIFDKLRNVVRESIDMAAPALAQH